MGVSSSSLWVDSWLSHRGVASLLVTAIIAAPFAAYVWDVQVGVEREAQGLVDSEAGQVQESWRDVLRDAAAGATLVRGFAARQNATTDAAFRNLTELVVADTEGVESAIFLGPDGGLEWTVPAGLVPSTDFRENETWSGLRALAATAPMPLITSLLPFEGDARGLVIVTAMRTDGGRLDGYLLLRLPFRSLVQVVGLHENVDRFAYTFSAGDIAVTLGERAEGEAVVTASRDLDVDGMVLLQAGDPPRLVLEPANRTLDAAGGRFPLIIGILGSMLSAGSGLATWRGLARHADALEARRQILESEEHYRTLFRNAGEMIFLLGEDGGFRDANPKTISTLGYSLDELRRMTLVEVLANDDREPMIEALRALRDTAPRQIEWTFEAQDGAAVEAYGTLTLSQERAGIVVQAHLADITRLKRLERQLRAANEALRLRVSDLDAFARGVAHDLKNPIRAVSSFAEFVAQDEAERLSEEGRENVGRIREGAERMRKLVDAMLQYASVGGGQYPFETTRVADVVEEAIRDLEPLIRERDAHVAVSPDLPELRAQTIPLRQVFANLVSNAVKHNPRERPKVFIDAGASGPNTYEFVVEDDGPGIPVAEREHVFDLFHRGAATESQGYGVGLSIVHRIVRRHGGRIWVEDREGGGTSIHFTISEDAESSFGNLPAPPL